MVANSRKCHLLTSSNLPDGMRITNTNISDVERVRLLREDFEGRLNFNYHVNTLLKNAKKEVAPSCKSMQLHGHKKPTCSNEGFYNISIFLLSSCLDVP